MLDAASLIRQEDNDSERACVFALCEIAKQLELINDLLHQFYYMAENEKNS